MVCISHAFCLLGDENSVEASGHVSLQIVIAEFNGDEATTESLICFRREIPLPCYLETKIYE